MLTFRLAARLVRFAFVRDGNACTLPASNYRCRCLGIKQTSLYCTLSTGPPWNVHSAPNNQHSGRTFYRHDSPLRAGAPPQLPTLVQTHHGGPVDVGISVEQRGRFLLLQVAAEVGCPLLVDLALVGDAVVTFAPAALGETRAALSVDRRKVRSATPRRPEAPSTAVADAH